MITTSRFASALASIITAVAAWLTARYLAADQATAALVAAVASAVTGLLVPAAAAPVGTVDAGQQRSAADRLGDPERSAKRLQ